MRNLSIGALIVCGGTIAALPFRRDTAVQAPATPTSGLITTSMSELAVTDNSVPYDPWFVDADSLNGTTSRWHSSSSAMSLASQSGPPHSVSDLRQIPSDVQPQPRRDLHVPLTYDDLAVPLKTTHFRDGRFNALANRQPVSPRIVTNTTTNVASDGLMQSNRRFEALPVLSDRQSSGREQLPPWQMASDLPQSILQPPAALSASPAAPHQPAPAPAAVVGRLASDARPREQSPAAETMPPRERHWIRQPD